MARKKWTCQSLVSPKEWLLGVDDAMLGPSRPQGVGFGEGRGSEKLLRATQSAVESGGVAELRIFQRFTRPVSVITLASMVYRSLGSRGWTPKSEFCAEGGPLR